MSPLLVAMLPREGGDGGAGRVFFVSTLGSVAGVLVTAFIFMSHFTNFQSLLITAISLALLTVLNLPGSRLATPGMRKLALLCALVALVLDGSLLAMDRRYLEAIAPHGGSGESYRILDERSSVFGDVKIVEMTHPDFGPGTFKAFLQDGIVQNRVGADGRSVAVYTYGLERLAVAHRPDAKRALVLGLGAGEVPMRLAERGIATEVVEINPDAVGVAKDHFGFDPAKVKVHVADARTFVRGCHGSFDILVIDLFHGDSTPDYLLTKEFMQDASRCLSPGGKVVANIFFDPADDAPNRLILATAGAAFRGVAIYHQPLQKGWVGFVNAFLVAGNQPFSSLPAVDRSDVPAALAERFALVMDNGRVVERSETADVTPATDEFNPMTVVYADSRKRFRQLLATQMPPLLLIN